MSKGIPIALQSDYDQDATTLCLITRILTKSGVLFGFTDLDVDIDYDPSLVDPEGTGDDWGLATHRADNGFTPSRMQASADTSVDNSELAGIVSDTGITMQQIRAGLFDAAKVRVYRINYMDVTKGHELMQSGTSGETRFSDNGWRTEFRSLTQQLKQPISPGYSLTCRARFASKAIGAGTADSSGSVDFEEAHPCGKDFTWYGGAVTSIGASPRTTFTDTGLTQADSFFNPGVVEWLSGNNAGHQMEVDDQANDSTGKSVRLALPMPYSIEVGDTYRIRQDCSKIHDDADHGCLHHWGADWIYHFQGEPDIPVSDGGANMIPGAQITRS
jgi:uncharacterized phage protein (TIGR02218 family)